SFSMMLANDLDLASQNSAQHHNPPGRYQAMNNDDIGPQVFYIAMERKRQNKLPSGQSGKIVGHSILIKIALIPDVIDRHNFSKGCHAFENARGEPDLLHPRHRIGTFRNGYAV